MGLCCVSCYDDSALVERIDVLEKNAIASINEQINAIKASITSLEAVDAELKSTIKDLEAKDGSLQGDIDKLKEADTSLETKIGELKTYVDEEISNTEDQATATFATIEQYNEIVKELSSLKEIVESNYATLDKKIDDSIESIKTWVNEALKSYYTSEEVDELLNSLKDDLDALQAKLDNLLRDFIITFDDSEIGILAGGTTSVGYTITGATEKTTVKALGQNGWSAKVIPDGTDKGTITVTAPNPLTEDEIIVLVYDGEYRTIMSSINFVTGVVAPSQTAVEVDAEAGTVDITVTSNLNYKVSIPEDAKDWLSVVQTKSTNTETITFAYTENEFTLRRADISFVDEADNKITKVSIIQQGLATEVTLTEAGTLLNSLGSDIYQSVKSLKINGPINGSDVIIINRMTKLENLDLSNASITEGGEPYIGEEYSSNDCIGYCMFQNATFKNIILPNTITTIEPHAFAWSKTLESVVIGEKVTIIDEYAFHMCQQLSKIILNDVLEIIGDSAFNSCEKITTISIPNTVQIIDDSAFRKCKSLKELILPSELTYIGSMAFQWNSFTKITIPAKVEYIGEYAFYDCENLDEIHILALPSTLKSMLKIVRDYTKPTLYIPKGTYNEYFYTELGNFSRIIEEQFNIK